MIGIIRVCVFTQAFYEPQDGRFETGWGPSLNAIETSLGIMTACLPTLSPLLRKWFPRIFRNFRRAGTEQRRYYEQGGSSGGKEHERHVQVQDFSHRHNPRSISNSTAESQEGFFKHAGIRKTTNVSIPLSLTLKLTQRAADWLPIDLCRVLREVDDGSASRRDWQGR